MSKNAKLITCAWERQELNEDEKFECVDMGEYKCVVSDETDTQSVIAKAYALFRENCIPTLDFADELFVPCIYSPHINLYDFAHIIPIYDVECLECCRRGSGECDTCSELGNARLRIEFEIEDIDCV